MPLLSNPNDPARQPRLDRAAWLEAALAELVEGGETAVQITRLARRLAVTRGSFYWHFENREALLEAVVAEWRARNTGVMVDALEGAATLEDGILALFGVWVDHTRFDPALDQALRDWARRAPEVHAILAAEDDSRVQAIAAFFARLGYAGTEAFIRARVLYFTQVSYYALGIDETLAERVGYLEDYFRCFTGREIDPDRARAFREACGVDAP